MTSDLKAIKQLTGQMLSAFSKKDNIVPDLDILYHLFIKEGRILKMKNGHLENYSVKEFVEPRKLLMMSTNFEEFEEFELNGETAFYGDIAQRWLTYRKRGVLNGESFLQNGIKTIQFVRQVSGWKISSLLWEDERVGESISKNKKIKLRLSEE